MRAERVGNTIVISWCNDIENSAWDQIENLSKLPFLYEHIAIMPDCLSENTEILTEEGFKLISDIDIKKNKIANYDIDQKKSFFDYPLNKIVRERRENEKVYELSSAILNKSIVVSEKHRMAYKDDMGVLCEKLNGLTYLSDYVWGSNGLLNEKEFNISDEMLCLIAWVVGDGSIKKSNKRKDGKYSTRIVRFGFCKERKIERVKHLLDILNFSYNERKDLKQITIELRVIDSAQIINYVGDERKYPIEFIAGLSTRQALLFLEECLKVDGDWINFCRYNTFRYNSKKEKDMNFLSSLISLHFGMALDSTRYSEGYNGIHKMHYLKALPVTTLYESNNGISKSKWIKKEIIYNKKLVCVTCKTGFFIARQNGLTFISGNCHTGYGMPIGGVIATDGVVIPNAVGVDIGCGMVTCKTNLKAKDTDQDLWKRILGGSKENQGGIRSCVPVGFNRHSKKQDEKLMPRFKKVDELYESVIVHSDGKNLDTFNHKLFEEQYYPIVSQEYKSALKQIGTLGGGNHFIEIQEDDEGYVWIMIHSGSRNLGYKIAKHYNKLAQELCTKWYSNIPPIKGEDGLAFLPCDSDEGKMYMREMNYALEFAYANRQLMMTRIQECFNGKIEDIKFEEEINIHHNYATWENHFGKNVVVHRKGATSAKEGQLGIIPGSQGTSSYIVRGLGNKESFESCSHGAGRVMSRGKARAELSLEDEQKMLNDQGIIHSIRHKQDLDEASSAYKDIEDVMDQQQDLVEVVTKLKPLAVIKG